MKIIKAVVKEKPGAGYTLRDIDSPFVADDEVLVQVKAAGICGSDLHIIKWDSGYEWLEDYMPLVIGHEFSGVVAGIGRNVSNLQPGDRVASVPGRACGTCAYCISNRTTMCGQFKGSIIGLRRDGCFAAYVSVPAEQCLKIPDSMSYDIAALVEPIAVAANAIEISGLELGSQVVVLGLGPIGLLLVMLARARGAGMIMAVDTSESRFRIELARRAGATEVLTVDDTDVVAAVLQKTGGMGADLVFEATGVSSSIQQGLDMLQMGNNLVALGIHSEPASFRTTDLVRQGKGIKGSFSGGIPVWNRVIQLATYGNVDFSMAISHKYRLEQADEAFALCLEKDKPGKVMFVF